MMNPVFHPEKMYTFLRGYAAGAGMRETLKALAFAREMHKGQFRKSGEPYIVHPLTMACNAVSMGIKEDAVVATILLHDVCEDCDVGVGDLPVSDVVKHAVDLMTFRIMEGESKEVAKNRYYNMLMQSHEAAMTKLIDRCHNVSSMAGTFSIEKLKSYIEETRHYVLPLLRKVKDKYPEDSNILFVLKYHIVSVVDSIEATIQVFEAENNQNSEKKDR